MSINKYDEQKFWEEVDILFPDIVKAITSLAKKSYISITNLRNGVTWWSEKAMEYFGMQENYTIRGQEKSKRPIHPDDLEEFWRSSGGDSGRELREKIWTSPGNTGCVTEVPTTGSVPGREC